MSIPFYVEVVQNKLSGASVGHIKDLVRSYLSSFLTLTPGTTFTEFESCSNIDQHVESITLCDVEHKTTVQMSKVNLVYHVFTLYPCGPDIDTITDATSGEELTSAQLWSLPCKAFHGMWESLIYDTSVKEDTLHFVETAFDFTNHGVDPMLLNCNRVVLLHGPPGTGKTSLCKALAHKLSIRLQSSFPRAQLLEINSHSLFSKWFSESGKLVFKLFDKILQIVEDRQMLVCVLIDEIESLAHARKAALSGLEPSDSLRVVNAILTQLDRIREYPNVLILTTSNVTDAIDIAFVDRADIKCYIGPPSTHAAFEILRGSCEELMKKKIIHPHHRLFDIKVLQQCSNGDYYDKNTTMLFEIAQEAARAQLSARGLRRLPFLARALYPHVMPNLTDFLQALSKALTQQLKDTEAFKSAPIEKQESYADQQNLSNLFKTLRLVLKEDAFKSDPTLD